MSSSGIYFDWLAPLDKMSEYAEAIRTTLLLAIICCVCATVFGIIFGYIRHTKKPGILYVIVTVYVEFIRNTPLLVQMFFLFYGLPVIGLVLQPFWAAVLALCICHTAYMTEIFRSGIQSVNKGQWEAAQCIGLSRIKAFVYIILPQTVRTVFPTLSNQYIATMLSTSLVAALNVNDITNVTQINAVSTFKVIEFYVFAVICYYIITLTLSAVLRFVNRKFFLSVSRKGE